MSNQKLALLALVAAVLVGVAVLQNKTHNGKGPALTGPAYLIQGLDPSQIAQIVIEKGQSPVTLVRQDQGFRVKEKSNYPADPKQINDLLTKCMDIETTELVSQNVQNQADLGVTEAKAKDVVKFLKADGSLITGIVIGNSKEGGQGTYVRRVDSNDVYLTSSSPYIRKRALDYLDQNLITTNKDDITSVTVKLPDSEYTLTNDPNAGIQLTALPAGRNLKTSEARSVLNALTGLRFDDVKKKADQNLTFDHTYQCRLKDSTVYTLNIAIDGKTYYVNPTCEYTDKSKVTIQPGAKDTPEQLKAKEAKLKGQENALKFTQMHSPWVYEIPEYKAKYFIKKMDDLLEAPEKPEESTNKADEIKNLVPDLGTGSSEATKTPDSNQ